MRRLLETVGRNNQVDLESIEQALRAAVLSAGTSILAELLAGLGSGRQQEPVLCGCGVTMISLGRKSKPLLTILGEVEFTRSLFQCPQCGATRFPGDELLDVVGTSRSPSLRRMMARAGSRSTFKEAQQDLAVYAGISVSAKDVERVAEATGEAIEKCREDLIEVIEEWIAIRLQRGLAIPDLDGYKVGVSQEPMAVV